MSVFKVGKATVTRIEETYLPVYPATDIFPELDEARLAEHAHWMARAGPSNMASAPSPVPLTTVPRNRST